MIERVDVIGYQAVDVAVTESVTVELRRKAQGDLEVIGLTIDGRAYRTAGDLPWGPFYQAVQKEIDRATEAQMRGTNR